METTAITCIDRSGNENPFVYILSVEVEHGVRKWSFEIWTPSMNTEDFFEFAITQCDEKYAKITTIQNNGVSALSAKGIPDKMIEIARKISGLDIISSTNKLQSKKFPSERRSDDANKFWLRLVRSGLAAYNSEEDVFYYTPGDI